MAGFRFMLPIMPTASLILLRLLKCQISRWSPRKLLRGYAVLCAVCALPLASPLTNQWHGDSAAVVGTIIGDYIRMHWPEDSLIALHTAGSVPYVAGNQRYIDMLGLNDAHIARRKVTRLRAKYQALPGHAKGDGAYVLARRPDYIIAGPAEGTGPQAPWFLSDVELFESAEFARNYRERRVHIDVHAYPDYAAHEATTSGDLLFTYYERITP